MNNTADIAIVNIPLSRRGNIDAEIDQHLAGQRQVAAAKRKADAQQFKADKALAKSLWISEADKIKAKVLATAANHPEFEISEMLSMVDSWVKWQPRTFLKWMAA